MDLVRSAPLLSLFGPGGVAWIDGCAGLLPDEPCRVQAVAVDGGDFVSAHWEFADGRALALRRVRGPGRRGSLRLGVQAEHGTAAVLGTDRVSWNSAGGRYTLTLPRARPLVPYLLEHFARVVRCAEAPTPSLEDAYRALGWLRAAARSRAEGCALALSGS